MPCPARQTLGLTWPSLPALASGPCRMGDGGRLNCTVGTQSTLIFSRPGWRSRAGATPAGETRRWVLAVTATAPLDHPHRALAPVASCGCRQGRLTGRAPVRPLGASDLHPSIGCCHPAAAPSHVIAMACFARSHMRTGCSPVTELAASIMCALSSQNCSEARGCTPGNDLAQRVGGRGH